mmetsp:Transcript_8078/g.23102  ORF Transcript_8078/g.23102 Transcript_8078/m.23102 type:complete len:104 (-) Transcript_8078:336-647(-)
MMPRRQTKGKAPRLHEKRTSGRCDPVVPKGTIKPSCNHFLCHTRHPHNIHTDMGSSSTTTTTTSCFALLVTYSLQEQNVVAESGASWASQRDCISVPHAVLQS